MKLKCNYKNKEIKISVEDFTISQIEHLLKLPKETEDISVAYVDKLNNYNEAIANYNKKNEPLAKLRSQVTSEYNEAWGIVFHKYEVNWEWLTFDKFEYYFLNPYDGFSYKKVLKSGAKSHIPRLEAAALAVKKMLDAEKQMVPPKKPYLYRAGVRYRIKNKEVSIFSGQNTTDEILKALEYKNKSQAISAKASAYDGTQRQLANSIKRDIKNQIHSLSQCPYCGMSLSIDGAHADHIYPVSKGGLSTTRNMVYICAGCNLKKSDMTLRNFINKFNLNADNIHQRLETLGKDF